MAARRNRDRDSGINEPGDETVDDPERWDTIEEDSDNSPINEDSPLQTPPEDIPEEIPIPMAVAPAGGVLPGQFFFGWGRRLGGLTTWAQGRHTNTWLVALSTPRGPTLLGAVCPCPLISGGPV